MPNNGNIIHFDTDNEVFQKDIKSVSKNESVTKEEREKCIFELRMLLKEEEKLQYLQCDDSYLERFLIVEDYNVEAAFKRIKLFYDILEENPSWYTKESPYDKKWMIEKDGRILLKERDKEGRPIYIIKTAVMDPSTMNFLTDVVALDDYFTEAMFLENMELDKNGLCVIVDIGNFPIKLTKWATPYNVKTAVKRIYSMPIKNFRYHVINSSFWLNIILKLILPFLPQYVKEQISFHLNDFEALHEHIDKDILPEEYKGTRQVVLTESQQIVLDKSTKIADNFKKTRHDYLYIINKSIKKSTT